MFIKSFQFIAFCTLFLWLLIVATQPPLLAKERNVASGFTSIVSGQGFDICALPTLTQMQTWVTASPYQVVNLYGGPLHACPASQATLVKMQQLRQQGWKFIPTWVGPQSQCWNIASTRHILADPQPRNVHAGSRRIDNEPTIAYNQGISQAIEAIEWAAYLGLTAEDRSQTIIYYDLEYYPKSDPTCEPAAHAFMRGWIAQMHVQNNLAGLYTTSCAMPAYANFSPALDAVWIARFLTPYQYRSDASVWGMPCIDDSLWNNQQRIVQYAGGHAESWGGITITIDSNVIDGVVALGNPDATPLPTRTPTPTITPTPSATVTGTITTTPEAPATAPAPTLVPTALPGGGKVYLPIIARQ